MNCNSCKKTPIKRGFNKNKQRLFCKNCNLYYQIEYRYKKCSNQDELMISRLNNEGISISGIARITGMSKANVINKINMLAAKIIKPEVKEDQQEYEVDEMRTFIKSKNNICYITYAINKKTKRIIDFVAGPRTKENLGKVIGTVNKLNPKRIFTDKLNIYPGLINRAIHTASAYKINHIERFNLTLRTHLKRLTRKTICFSKSKAMLENCLKIYLYSGASAPGMRRV